MGAGTHAHRGDQGAEESLEVAHAEVLDREEGERVDARDQAAHPHGDCLVAQEVDCHTCANDLLNIGGDDSELHVGVYHIVEPARVFGAYSLCEIAARHYAQSRAHLLQDESHEGRPKEDPHESDAGVCALAQIALEIARVEVREAHEPSRPRKAPELPPRQPEAQRLDGNSQRLGLFAIIRLHQDLSN